MVVSWKLQAGEILPGSSVSSLPQSGPSPETERQRIPDGEPQVAREPSLSFSQKKPGADDHGDELPPGALARLGTVRHRAPNSQLALTPDGKEIIAVDTSMYVRRFDVKSGALQVTSRLPESTHHSGNWTYRLSPHGSFVLTLEFSKASEKRLNLWDARSGKLSASLDVGDCFLHGPSGLTFSSDENFVGLAIGIRQ